MEVWESIKLQENECYEITTCSVSVSTAFSSSLSTLELSTLDTQSPSYVSMGVLLCLMSSNALLVVSRKTKMVQKKIGRVPTTHANCLSCEFSLGFKNNNIGICRVEANTFLQAEAAQRKLKQERSSLASTYEHCVYRALSCMSSFFIFTEKLRRPEQGPEVGCGWQSNIKYTCAIYTIASHADVLTSSSMSAWEAIYTSHHSFINIIRVLWQEYIQNWPRSY